jgi:M6 family metalloprotease-like protein
VNYDFFVLCSIPTDAQLSTGAAIRNAIYLLAHIPWPVFHTTHVQLNPLNRKDAMLRRFLLAPLGLCLTFAGLASAQVYDGQTFVFRQPNQQPFTVVLRGSDLCPSIRTQDGYAIIKGGDGWYYYAKSNPMGGVQASSLRVGAGDPGRLGLSKDVKMSALQRASVVREQQLRRKKDERGRFIKPSATGARASTTSAALTSADTEAVVGVRRGLTLLISFPDKPQDKRFTTQDIDRFCNDLNYTQYGNNGSVRTYFARNSLGRLDYTNLVTSYYQAKHPKAYYTDPQVEYTVRARELIFEALDGLDGTIDFKQFDGNQDGLIDALNVFYAGDTDNNWSEGLWPHSSGIEWKSKKDAKAPVAWAYQFTSFGEPEVSPNEMAISTFCHENLHLIGNMNDVYGVTDSEGEGGVGVGSWSHLASNTNVKNPARVDGYSAARAGWRDVVDLTSQSYGARTIVAESKVVYRYRNPKNPYEYYLIENRQQQSESRSDAAIPGSGIAIWHCDETGDNYYYSSIEKPSDPGLHYELALVQADDRFDLEFGENIGDATDLWYRGNPASTGSISSTAQRKNNTLWWDGTDSGLVLRDFSANGTVMTFTVGATFPNFSTVSVSSSGPVREGHGFGSFVIERNGRTGDPLLPLTVRLLLGGSAIKGIDYSISGASSFLGVVTVRIPQGSSSARIDIRPIDDGRRETTEKITATLLPGDYAFSRLSSAVMDLYDNDLLPVSFLEKVLGDGRLLFTSYNSALDAWTLIGSASLTGDTQAENAAGIFSSLTGNAIVTVRLIPDFWTLNQDDIDVRFGLTLRAPGAGSQNSESIYSRAQVTDELYQATLGVIERRVDAPAQEVGTPVTIGRPDVPIWFRMIRRGNVVTSQYGADGVRWNTIATRTLTLPRVYQAGLYLQGGTPEAPVRCKFDSFVIAPLSSN